MSKPNVIESGLEVVPQEERHRYFHDNDYPEVNNHANGIEVFQKPEDSDKYATVVEQETLFPQLTRKTPWWKRRKFLLLIAGVVVLIAIAIGLGVGLGTRKVDESQSPASSSGNNTTDVRKGPCSNNFCTQALATTTTDEGTGSTLYIARTTNDGLVQYRATQGSAFEDWIDVEGPGNFSFTSRPGIVYWKPESQAPRLDFYAVDSQGNSLVQRYFQNGTLSPWKEIAADVGYPPGVCRLGGVNMNRADTWHTSATSHAMGHTFVSPAGSTQAEKLKERPYETDTIMQRMSVLAASAPGVICGPGAIAHNVIVYDYKSAEVTHRQWNNSMSSWTDPRNLGGNFIDEPYVLDTAGSSTRIDFFGIGNDKSMYWFNWQASSGHSELISLGGQFASAPSAISATVGKVDVVAVGLDGNLKHRVLDGETWADKWEDLEISASGAPYLVEFGGKIYLFVSSDGGEIFYATMDAGNPSWDIKDSLQRLD